jgi:UDP-N-acetylmuramate--alanine ligase
MQTNDMQHIRFVYLLGVGGIGMSALARYFHAAGKIVCGYDRTSTALTEELVNSGISIHFNDDVNSIPVEIREEKNRIDTLVILTPAVPVNHSELNFFREKEYTILKRSQVLGMLTASQFTMAVAGTHGKTTTSSILAHILHSSGMNCTAFLGGISVNTGSNLLLGDPDKKDHTIVVEADEFDRSFLSLFPDRAIITSMDADHLDIYGDHNVMQTTYQEFANQVKPDGILLYKKGLPLKKVDAMMMSYSIHDHEADYRGENITVRDGRYHFDLVTPGYILEGLELGLPGRHNVENAVAASALAIESGVELSSLIDALVSYAGVRRRFEVHIRLKDLVYIDDYAHHPEELKAAITSVRELYPGRKITGIFQPHLYSRTRDFALGFAESLSLLDNLYLLDIYPAREEPIPGITSSMILDKVTISEKKLVTKQEVLDLLKANRPEVLITLGAGDIDQLVKPVTQLLNGIA